MAALEREDNSSIGSIYFFVLLDFRPRPDDLPLGDFRFFALAALFAIGARAAGRVFFLGCRVLAGERPADVATLAASRTFVVTFSGSAERFSANSIVTLVSVPAALPILRATAFRRGS